MYKRSYFLLLALLCAVISLRAQQDTVPVRPRNGNARAQIRQALEAQAHAWNEGDLDAFMQAYWNSDSVTFITKNGPVYGYQVLLDHYRQAYQDKAAMGVLRFSDLQITRLSPQYAFVIGAFHLVRAAGNLNGNFTLLFRRIGGQWKIVVDHSS